MSRYYVEQRETMEEFNDFEAILAIKASDWADSHESNPI